ncbi:acylneuraminate cytidylyltransferase [Halobacillus litoralis]|uniref:Acylneuraminate cytidylyltransferase n=1 Tax=Halobacillus litoralis TaxID=45668 RepID=A0A845EH11_9BACI|nr:glycosyltransferase family protein [Halobacillus litoralis]MYL50488.1 acylneuraminate cytidylyltransferase [Halobacillus litoralis]
MNVVAIIQAQLEETAYPGMILNKVNGKPLLAYLIERVRRSKRINQLVVSTSIKESDDAIVHCSKKLNVETFRGSKKDVLGRFYETGRKYKADVVVRLSARGPLIDPAIIDHAVEMFFQQYPNRLYVSNTLQRTYPKGMDIEIFTYESLKDAYMNASSSHDFEQVTPFIVKRVGETAVAKFVHDQDLSHHDWTVDTMEGFTFMKAIFERVHPSNPAFSMEDVLTFIEND